MKENIITERVVEVSDDGKKWYRRVLIKTIKEGNATVYVCWAYAETIEEAKNDRYTLTWLRMREAQEKPMTAEMFLNKASNIFSISELMQKYADYVLDFENNKTK